MIMRIVQPLVPIVGIAVVLGLAAAGFAAPSGAPSTPVGAHPGAALFAANCAICHDADDLAARFHGVPDPDRLAEELVAFLRTHGRADAAANAQIVDYLRATAASN